MLVTFEDGSSDVIALQDDLGVERDDFPLIRKRLYMQGVRDVASISSRINPEAAGNGGDETRGVEPRRVEDADAWGVDGGRGC